MRYGSDTDASNDSGFVAARLTYLPDGWSIASEYSNDDLYSCDIANTSSGFVRFSQCVDLENGLGVDNDVYEEEIIYMKNDTIEANLFLVEDSEYVLIWKDGYMFRLEAENIELEELIKIAESIE